MTTTRPIARAALITVGALLGQLCTTGVLAAAQPSAAASQTDPSAAQRKTALRRSAGMSDRQRQYYVARWGVDKFKVSYTSSGNLIRFTYRVADPALAKPLADRDLTPYMLGLRSRALLHIPVMEKVGPLRQAMALESGKEYWMTFSNKGNLVRPGDRVNVMIGPFHADGLLVE